MPTKSGFGSDFLHQVAQVLAPKEAKKCMAALQEPREKTIRLAGQWATEPKKAAAALEAAHQRLCAQIHPFGGGLLSVQLPKGMAIGNLLEHFLGLAYVQEASSLLPVLALGPQRGELVLDMCAAPGSKATALAEQVGPAGAMVANEPAATRRKKLVANLARMGSGNAVVTGLPGEMFGRECAEVFGAALVDAPCTGMGMARTDRAARAGPSAVAVAAAAKLQRRLLACAVRAVAAGGVVVYSTCTLPRAENEQVVQAALAEFGDCLAPQELPNHFPGKMSGSQAHMARIWPHKHAGEAFFVAKLRKTAPCPPLPTASPKPKKPRFLPLSKGQIRQLSAFFQHSFGFAFGPETQLVRRETDGQIFAMPACARALRPLAERMGVPLGRLMAARRATSPIIPSHEWARAFGHECRGPLVHELSVAEAIAFARGQDLPRPPKMLGNGSIVLRCKGRGLGMGKLNEKGIKNLLPREICAELH